MVKIEFIAVVEDRRNEFKLRLGVDNSPNQYNNPMGYKLGLGLAERKGFVPKLNAVKNLLKQAKLSNKYNTFCFYNRFNRFLIHLNHP